MVTGEYGQRRLWTEETMTTGHKLAERDDDRSLRRLWDREETTGPEESMDKRNDAIRPLFYKDDRARVKA